MTRGGKFLVPERSQQPKPLPISNALGFTAYLGMTLIVACDPITQPPGDTLAPATGSPPLVEGGDPGNASATDLRPMATTGNQPGTPPQAKPSGRADADPRPTRLPSGVEFTVLQPGRGPTAQPGTVVEMHCRGWNEDGRDRHPKVFLDTRASGVPGSYLLSPDPLKGRRVTDLTGPVPLIPGLYEGSVGMKRGEVRRVTVPTHLGYGSRGYPQRVPMRAKLFFEVELIDFTAPEPP